ncbi:hypothetical protein RS030_101585 [Cryptosporidium xiaoi]|uniref:START domain-containing protein n=1 Tax=Cryptosporidium xiaoi TaxID=659607 RepID=A0AAV9Y398_9CRYT
MMKIFKRNKENKIYNEKFTSENNINININKVQKLGCKSFYQEKTRNEINENEISIKNNNLVDYSSFDIRNDVLNLKTFKFNEIVDCGYEMTPKNSTYSENTTPNSTLIFLETSVGSARNSFIGETPQTNESISFTNDKNGFESENGELELDINKLEELYEKIHIYIKNNYPYYAYSKYLELSMLLYSILSKYGIDNSVYLEMSLVISSNNVLNNSNLNYINDNESQNFSSIYSKNIDSFSHKNIKHTGGRCSPIILSPFHSSLKGIKLSSNKITNNLISELNISNSNYDKKNQSQNLLIYLDLIYLNRNGVPIKNSTNNIIGNGNNPVIQGGSGITRRLKNKLASVVEFPSSGSLGNNNNIKRGKLFAECFPLLENNNESAKKTISRSIKNNTNDTSLTQNAKIFSLDEFPCMIFSNNCFPVFSNKFSSIKSRNYSLNYIKFPTEVRCIIRTNESESNYEKNGEFDGLKNFIVKLVTDIHIHRLRFSLYKCSSSYMDLVSALKMRKKTHIKCEDDDGEKDRNINLISDQKDNINDNSKHEWNSFGDSNMGMWWAMRSESEFLILCDCIVNTCPLNVLSIVNESDLHLHWAPFVNNSECLSYIGLYTQIVRHSSNMPWPIGLCQCSLYCVAIDAHRKNDLSEEPFIIITAVSIPDKSDSVCGIKVKDTQINASKLDILSLCFVIQPIPNSPMQTRISFLSKSIIPIPNFVPKAVPSFIAKQVGKSFYNNIINIIERFNGSPFYYRLNTDFEFYGFIAKRLKIKYNNFDQEIESENEMDICKSLKCEDNCLYLDKINTKNQNQDISPSIKKRKTKNDLKQKKEMLEEFNKFNSYFEDEKELIDNDSYKGNTNIEKPIVNYFADNIHEKLGSMFPSI